MNRTIRLYGFILLISGIFSCREVYDPPVVSENHNYLVVEGIISSGQPTIIQLSRTRKLNDTVLFIPEANAGVYIQSEHGENHTLQHIGNGKYQSPTLTLNQNDRYRVRVTTVGSSYVSDFESVKNTPAIDSLSWRQERDVIISVNTHDATNSTWYYRWEYVETWEYWAYYDSNLGFRNGQVYYRDSIDLLNICWSMQNSSDVMLATSAKLSQDRIDQVPVAVVSSETDKITMRYSILVKQYALTQKAFEYWETLRKNSKDLGSIFGVQPSQLIGNIKCVTNPTEPVIGYITASSVAEKRIFIRRSELTEWHEIPQLPYCTSRIIPPDSAFYVLQDTTLAPAHYVTGGGLAIAKNSCVDCRRRGGNTIKPSYW